MIDEIAIQQTLTRYCEAVSSGDWDGVAATFVEDGIWQVGSSGKTFQGRAAIREGMKELSGAMEFVVMMNAPGIITVDGMSAAARTTIREFGKIEGREEGFEAFGIYEDRLVSTPKGWRFSHRLFTLKAKHSYALLPGGVAAS